MTATVDIGLTPGQLELVTAPERFVAAVTGIGFGKTTGLCVRHLGMALGHVAGTILPTPNIGVLTAPTYRNLKDAVLRTFLEVAGPAIDNYNKSDMVVTLINGSEVLFRSVDNFETLRGPSILHCGMDEAALAPEMVWKIMLGRLRQFGIAGYMTLATTPRGRDWIWQKFAQRKRPDYRLIHGRTADNYFLSRDYVASLVEEYAGDFALQELEGHFIAHEGLVYPEFSEAVHVERQTVNVRHFKTIAAGVDWGFVNPGVILVGGIDGDSNVKVLHEAYERNRRIEDWVSIGKELRDTYRIERFYCDPSEPEYIRAFNEAGLRAVAADNRVQPGIQAVRQKLVVRDNGRPGLTITGAAPNLIREFGQYQWEAGREGMRDQPRKAADHACFVAGTLITTRRGNVPIEEIQSGDEVLTRNGYRKVTAAGLTQESAETLTVSLSNGRTLCGTANHPVWVEGRGFVPMGDLATGDRLQTTHNAVYPEGLCHDAIPSSSAGLSSIGIQTPRTGQIAVTTRQIRYIGGPGSVAFIKRYGKRRTGQYPTDTKYITLTATRLTMRSTILSVCGQSTIESTTQPITALSILNGCAKTSLSTLYPRRPSGTEAQRGGHGTVNMDAPFGKADSQSRSHAHNVAVSMRRSRRMAGRASVQTIASPHIDAPHVSMMLTDSVNGADRRSASIGMRGNGSVHASVVRVVVNASREPVYNLSVSGKPEYYANGVLVHNCDALRYLIVGAGVRTESRMRVIQESYRG